MPDVEELRSVSKFGISVVTIVFKEATDIYRARQLVTERLSDAAANISPGYGTPTVGPLTTALGEILQFEVRSDRHSPMELRTMLEWEISPKLRQVSGVTEINTHGGFYKTFEVQPDPDRKTRDELIEQMSEELSANVPGVAFGFTQPIEMRVDELVAGVKADVAVLLYGDDMEILGTKGKEIEALLRSIPGAVDVEADYQANLSTLTIKTKPQALAQYGIDAQTVLDVVSSPKPNPLSLTRSRSHQAMKSAGAVILKTCSRPADDSRSSRRLCC